MILRMKLNSLSLFATLAVMGVLGLAGCKPGEHADEEKIVTEVGVRVGKITRTTLRSYVTAYGTVEAEPAGERPAASARVASPVTGVVTAVHCADGQRVEKGAVLFQLDSRAADITVEKARAAAEFAGKTFARQQKLMQGEGTSQKLMLEAEQQLRAARSELAAAQTQQALLRITAPLAGIITRINVKPGEAVDLTTVLAEIADLDRLVVSANVPGAELTALKPGQPAEVLADSTTAPVATTLGFISPQIDAKTSAVLVRAAVPRGCGLRPGQFVTLRVVSDERKDRLAVPVESVVKTEDGGSIIALVTGDRAVQKLVKTGVRDGGLVEVEADGLKEGDAVVTVGAYGLPKETKIRVIGQ